MSIEFSDDIFHLRTRGASYAFCLLDGGRLGHLFWGAKIGTPSRDILWKVVDRAFSPNSNTAGERSSYDTIPQEFPTFGDGDFRSPAVEMLFANGSTVCDLRYTTHQIRRGKLPLPGLPATYVEDEAEANTLEIKLRDPVTGLCACLSYSVFEEFDAITRSVRLINEGTEDMAVLRLLSASVDFPNADLSLLHLAGAWGRERHLVRALLQPGTQSFESRRGASSHQHNPFFALLSPTANEDYGEVYGFSLVYSGNFLAQVEVDQFQSPRAAIGLNPFDFSWQLRPGEEFQSPEAVLVFSAQGMGEMSRTFHRLYRRRLCRGQWRDLPRPVLINNWEATYFDFDAAKIQEIASAGRELGIELFVLDDGWFGKRDNDQSSLGDWTADRRKLPDGIEGVARQIASSGMGFGLWFEPEMVSPDSDLYRAHPDWCLHVPGRHRTEGRNQLVLDLSRTDVREHLIEVISAVLASAPITYVKWDMNRHMTEVGSAALPPQRQRETAHRYILGLYAILEVITSRFPRVLFESCSGGGGRFDPGMLFYMPQTWTSDNSDAVSRMKIQYGTSLAYPLSAMGAHVSAAPNHQVGRVASLPMRGLVAMSGNFGYELDLARLTQTEKQIVRTQVALYKEIRSLVQTGDFYRLRDPFAADGTAAWMIVDAAKTAAVCFYFRVLAEANPPLRRLRLRGLDATRNYEIVELGQRVGGDMLMHAGLFVPDQAGDFCGTMWRLYSSVH